MLQKWRKRRTELILSRKSRNGGEMMKKVVLLLLVLCLTAGVATVWATVIGTPHDLAPEPCAMCHTPHSGTGDYPLWNRLQGAVNYDLYESLTFDMGPTTQPRNPSALCLVCHNGIASELVNYPGPCSNPDAAYDIEVAGCADLGTELQNEHPISFNYDATQDIDNNGFPVSSTYVRGSNTRLYISGDLTATEYYLYGEDGANDWFECATCHSVHDLVEYDGKGEYQVYFLRADNTGSQMCKDCHVNR
jgi:hypothetical protein